jgi:hypothetical protein
MFILREVGAFSKDGGVQFERIPETAYMYIVV